MNVKDNAPNSGPGWNSIKSLSSATNSRSCGPYQERSCGSVLGSSGRPPRREYPRIAVRFRLVGCSVSYTFCKPQRHQPEHVLVETSAYSIVRQLHPRNSYNPSVSSIPIVVRNQTTFTCTAFPGSDVGHPEPHRLQVIERCWVQNRNTVPA